MSLLDEIDEISFEEEEISEFSSLHPFMVALCSDCFCIVELLCFICPFHLTALLSPSYSNPTMFFLIKNVSKDIIQHFLLSLDYSISQYTLKSSFKSDSLSLHLLKNTTESIEDVQSQVLLRKFLSDWHNSMESEGDNLVFTI